MRKCKGSGSFTPDERENFFNRRQHSFAFPQTAHGFIGRELDTHQIERQLTHRHNILLLRGMGGTGKTTLLRYLGAWWQTTGLVDQVFYFGYDEHPWSYQEIMDSIASHVLGKSDYYERVFQHLSLNARHAMLIRRLRSQRHLLILDNTESITGARLAIRHTLTRRQQADIRRFLADLEGGKTFVLLGSRRYEGWLTMSALSESPRNDDASANDRKPDLESVVAPDARISHLPTYHLTGLDTEAASLLTDAILKQHHIAYEEHQPFYESVQKLLKLLDGHPLALHVVLPNLAHQTPAELLEILDFDTTHFSHLSHLHDEEGNDKNLSLLRCIEYLYSNISSEAQELLCCLAPFTMADNQNLQESYIEHLKQQPALKHLSFDHWHEIIHEATRVPPHQSGA